MKPVKTMQKYKCDFCNYRSIKSRVEIHEKRCFRNKDRYCDFCDNKGYTEEYEAHTSYKQDCPYCSMFDKNKLEEIKAREAGVKSDELYYEEPTGF